RPLGQGMLPTQLITKPLAIEVLGRQRQRHRQIVAPVGAPLPATFRHTCRTSDQSGKIVVPILEENRIVKQLVITDLSPALPIGSAVEVEFAIDVKHPIEVRITVRQADRTETATIESAPAPRRPTRADIDDTWRQLEDELSALTGSLRSRLRGRAEEIRRDLLEALSYDDEPRSIQRLAELRDLVQQAISARTQMLDPPWPRFAQLVRDCLNVAADVARQTGRDRQELVDHVHTQERYAEKAYEDHNQPLYRECRENLEKYSGYLTQLLRDSLPRPLSRPA